MRNPILKAAVFAASTGFMIVAFSASPVCAQGQQSARALSLAGSVVAQPVGSEAVAWNPAALYSNPHALDLNVVGFGTRIRNNSFTIGDYNRYTGATLSTEDKNYIMAQVPQDGLRLDAAVDAQALTLSTRNMAVSFTSQGAANLDLSRDALELVLFGNTVFDTVNLSGTGGESFLTAGMGFTVARPLGLMAGGQLSGGITLRYLKGIFVQQVVRSNGSLTTDESGLVGDAEFVARTANGGSGFATDVGLMYDYGGGWTFGAALTNLIGHMSWSGNPEEYRYTFTLDTLNVLNAGDPGLIESHDTTYAIETFSSRLPATMRLGVGHQGTMFNWFGQWEQGLNTSAGAHTTPRLSAGAEWKKLNFMPLRAGLSLGGDGGLSLNWGAGLQAGLFYLDTGFGFNNGLAWSHAKGFDFALNMGLHL